MMSVEPEAIHAVVDVLEEIRDVLMDIRDRIAGVTTDVSQGPGEVPALRVEPY